MKNKSKIFLIFVVTLILFLFILLVIGFHSDYISDLMSLRYKEYVKQGDNFVYEFQYAETYTYLEEIIENYNKEYGHDTNNKILMGKDEKETVFAEYDENSITIYCEDIVNGKLTDSQLIDYLECLYDLTSRFYNPDSIYNYKIAFENFHSNLTFYHEGIAKLYLPLIFEESIIN